MENKEVEIAGKRDVSALPAGDANGAAGPKKALRIRKLYRCSR
jgi:hypothetical protein